ncbi:MAG: hypothetical protein ACYSVY_23860 [Planctomycetota bacterium]|jgi:hypothetical protein
MGRPLSKKLVFVVSFAVIAAFVISAGSQVASANPKDIPAGLKLEYKFNLIGYPEGKLYTGGCGNGHRIFVNRNAKHAHIFVTNGASWGVTDCDATGDKRGELTTSNVDKYYIFVRILGKLGGHLRICADTYEDHEDPETAHMCLLGVIDLTRGSGKSKFSVAPKSMFDASVEDIMWSVETNKDYRIAEFRVYAER